MGLDDVFRDIVRLEMDRVVEAVRDVVRRAQADIPTPKPVASVHLSVKQVAARLGVEPATVRGYFDRKLLAATKPQGKWMVRQEDLDAFLARRGEAPASPDDQLGRLLKKVQAF